MNEFPLTFRVRQQFEGPRVEDIEREVHEQLKRLSLSQRIRPGHTVAITAGSRGIANIARILRAAVAHLKELGARPLIVPAMGSHGSATAEGQRKLIESYGITEQFCACPIQSSMDTVVLGHGPQGYAIHFDRCAYEADHVLVCGRVKPHTGFSGQVQSGLLKMMMIGLGKRNGANAYHGAAVDFGFDRVAYDVAEIMIERGKIVAGLAIVENAYDETALIEAVAPHDFVAREKALLTLAREWMPRLPFDRADVLLIDEIGKDISGSGMDTNVVGRKFHEHQAAEDEFPKIRRIVIRGLTEQSHGNALGIGLSEFCLQRVVDAMDLEQMAINGVTSMHVSGVMVPLAYKTDREVLAAALNTIGLTAPADAKLMWIRNTLQVAEVECSSTYLDDARGRNDLSVLSPPRPLPLNAQGYLPQFVTDFSA
jgi:hypothetical protein